MATVTRTTTFADGNTLTAAQLNNEFNNLLNALSLVNADVSAGAAIVESKILFSGSGHGHSGGTDGKVITINRGFGFFIAGTPSIANDLSWNPMADKAVTAVRLDAYSRTAPSGSSLTIQVYNVTKAQIIATISITSGTNSATQTSMTNAAISQDDVLRCDITAIGSTTAGANVSVVLSCTQP